MAAAKRRIPENVGGDPAAGREPPVERPTGPEPATPAGRPARNWVRVVAVLVLLTVLVVFIAQNSADVRVSFFAAHWKIPLALDLLVATVLGGLVVFTAGSFRSWRQRRVTRRQRHGSAGGS